MQEREREEIQLFNGKREKNKIERKRVEWQRQTKIERERWRITKQGQAVHKLQIETFWEPHHYG